MLSKMKNEKYWLKVLRKVDYQLNSQGHQGQKIMTTELYLCMKFDEEIMNNFLET